MGLRPLACSYSGFESLVCVCCVGSELCDGAIPRQKESYRECVCVSLSVIHATITLYTYIEWVNSFRLRKRERKKEKKRKIIRTAVCNTDVSI